MKESDNKIMKKSSKKVLRLCYIAMFTAIICVVSQLPGIPMPGGVPMTLQTFIIPLAGVILGPWDGLVAALLYVLLGAVGVPVFSGFTGGIGVIMGATGGFIISFPLMPLFAGLGEMLGRKLPFGKEPADKDQINKKAVVVCYILLYCGLVLGAVLNYLIGTLWFAAIYLGAVNSETMLAGFTACVVPFIPTSVIKIILCGVIGMIIKKALVKAGLING